MKHLFTPKVRVLLFALLVCHLGVKAQTTDAADTSKKAVVLKTDTTLVVKAGATLVKRADTTLVINTDSAFIKKVETAIAKKANDLQVNDAAAVKKMSDPDASKTDASVTVKDTTSTGIKSGKTPSRISITSTTEESGQASEAEISSAAKKESAPERVTISSSTTTANPPANDVAQTDNSAKKDETPQPKPVVKQDSTPRQVAPVIQTDTTVKKPSDTTLVKKSDTTFKKSDTTLMVAADTSTDHQVKAQNLYLEVGGAGLAISGNYDARFKKERSGWGYRVGLGYFGSGGNTVFTIPFQINYLIGEHDSKFELGAGTTFLNSTGTNVGNSKWEFDKVTGFIGTATIGYRYQPAHKGLNFRIAFVPILYDEGLIAAGGVSIGYTFK
jgi:hypothetical protein